MISILYTLERPFQRKTYEAIDRHVDAESAYLPIVPGAIGSCDAIPEIKPENYQISAIDDTVRSVDPDVVVCNNRYRRGKHAFEREYPLVHVRHGASIGRNEVENTVEPAMQEVVDAALAPGERWADRYREAFPDRVDVSVVGIPEADDLATADPPRARRVLYAPTNYNYGGGCFPNTAEPILDLFADTEYELLFRPHPADQTEEPIRSLAERCRERIRELPNVVFDDRPTPGPALREADVLVSDYSGIVAEWLHADRPLIQLTDVVAEANEVPELGYVTSIDKLDLEAVDDLYGRGYPASISERLTSALGRLGIPMDGRAGERAAQEVVTCTQ